MSMEFNDELEKELENIQKEKRGALQKIINAYKSEVFEFKWVKFMQRKVAAVQRATEIFSTWSSKIEYLRFQKLMRMVGRLQLNWRLT
jgi:predicted acetyltransferase